MNESFDFPEKNWFEANAAGGGGGAEAGEAGETGGTAGAEAPSAAAGAPAAAHCALCGDPFLQFYNEDREEWHLRNALTHHDRHYHPLCLADYKVPNMQSLTDMIDTKIMITKICNIIHYCN